MNWEFFEATIFNLTINILYAIISLIVAILALGFVDRVLLTKIDIQQELKDNNVSVAIAASAILLFVALIISFGLKA
ncbi:MAG: DUF350 domain-containing protein [Flavobacteriales bacterium]|nr:DUF350 domain-containing protein [Flavobacteriales bacterium]